MHEKHDKLKGCFSLSPHPPNKVNTVCISINSNLICYCGGHWITHLSRDIYIWQNPADSIMTTACAKSDAVGHMKTNLFLEILIIILFIDTVKGHKTHKHPITTVMWRKFKVDMGSAYPLTNRWMPSLSANKQHFSAGLYLLGAYQVSRDEDMGSGLRMPNDHTYSQGRVNQMIT